MSLNVQTIFNLLGTKYKLRLLAGREGLSKTISWVYYTEDSSTIKYIRGGELAITLGVYFQRQKDNKGEASEDLTEFLKGFIENFIEHNASGLIINTGKYINEIPEKIVQLCDELNFPLFVMPWEVHTVDIMEEIGNMIATNRQNALTVENFFYNAIFLPNSLDINQIRNTHFCDAEEFAVALLDVNMKHFASNIESVKRYINFSFNHKLNIPISDYVCFVHDQKVIYILKDNFLARAKEIARVAANDKYFYDMRTSLSDSTKDIKDLNAIYSHAVYAMNLSLSTGRVNEYNSLGIYKILVEVKNKKVLEQIYESTLGKLQAFPQDKFNDYIKTLELFLKYGGNIQKISEENSQHRNTIIYRINRIEEMLKMSLSDGDVRCQIQIALYIKKLLGK